MQKILNNRYIKGAFIIIMAILLYFSFYDYSFRNEEGIEYNLRAITKESNQQTCVAVSEKLKDQIAILQTFASLIAYQDDITSEASFKELEPLLQTKLFTRVAVTDVNGISYTSDHFKHDSTDREYYVEGKKGNTYISNITTSLIDQSEVIIMSAPINKNNQFAGVLRATIDVHRVHEYFELSFLSGNVLSYLIQTDGLNLTEQENHHSNFFMMLEKNNNERKVIDDMKSDLALDKKGSITFQLNGKTRYAYYSPIENTDWHMLTILPQDIVQVEMDSNLERTLYLALKIGTIIAVSAGYFLYLQLQGSLEIKKMNKRMDAIISNTPGSSFKHMVTKPETIVFFNRDDRLLAGYNREEIVSLVLTDIYKLVFKDDYLALKKSLENLEPNTPISNTYRIINKDNQVQWIFDQRQIINEDNELYYYVEVVDITETKKVQEQLRISEERYQLILKETESVIFEWNIETDQITFSEIWTSKYGYPNRLNDFFLLTNRLFEGKENSYISLIDGMVTGKVDSDHIECVIPKSSGEEIWVKIFAKALLDEQGYLIRIVGSITDISQEKQKTIQLLERAQKDGLTKTYNRVTLENLIANEIEIYPNQEHIMLVIDIDNFKMVNDTLGHASGDEALTKFSEILISSFRKDDIVGRIGGDEFVVFMKYAGQDASKHIETKCQSILSAVAKIRLSKNAEYRMQCSIGVAMHPSDGSSYQQLFETADRRLYQAKSHGKNIYIDND